LIFGFIRTQLDGVVSVQNLNVAACSTWAGLKFEPGFEMADPRAEQKAQEAAEKERAEKEEAERKRQQILSFATRGESYKKPEKPKRRRKPLVSKTQRTT
jgi:hypothetical protein